MTDTTNATRQPTNSIAASIVVKERPNFKIFTKLAPNITGIARKNVNSAATYRDVPSKSAPTIVAPERDVPGISESTCHPPMSNAVCHDSCDSFVTFGIFPLFQFSTTMNKIPYRINIADIISGLCKCASIQSSNRIPITPAGIHATMTFIQS